MGLNNEERMNLIAGSILPAVLPPSARERFAKACEKPSFSRKFFEYLSSYDDTSEEDILNALLAAPEGHEVCARILEDGLKNGHALPEVSYVWMVADILERLHPKYRPALLKTVIPKCRHDERLPNGHYKRVYYKNVTLMEMLLREQMKGRVMGLYWLEKMNKQQRGEITLLPGVFTAMIEKVEEPVLFEFIKALRSADQKKLPALSGAGNPLNDCGHYRLLSYLQSLAPQRNTVPAAELN